MKENEEYFIKFGKTLLNKYPEIERNIKSLNVLAGMNSNAVKVSPVNKEKSQNVVEVSPVVVQISPNAVEVSPVVGNKNLKRIKRSKKSKHSRRQRLLPSKTLKDPYPENIKDSKLLLKNIRERLLNLIQQITIY